MFDCQQNDGFNERLLKLMCLNQACDKLQKELDNLTGVKDQLLGMLSANVESEKLHNLLELMRQKTFSIHIENQDPGRTNGYSLSSADDLNINHQQPSNENQEFERSKYF